MTESMKFGPEWLRALSAQQPARYQLAEFRYGREEMLALFSANLPPPESLKQLHGLYVEKAQPPLALNTMTDEETRMWNRGINSDVVLRSVGKGGDRGGGLRGAGTGAGTGGGGRGGRGRGAFYRPPTSERYEDGGDAPFSRQRPFDRSQSERVRGESWSERNGGEGRGGGRESNWRRGQRGGGASEEDDWRPYKWSISGRSNNWRDEESYDGNPNHPSSKNCNHHLPEWATEKNSEGGGTFDSSGAFHGASEQIEEEETKKNDNRNNGRERDKTFIGKGEIGDRERKEDRRGDREERERDRGKESGDGGREKVEQTREPSPSPVTHSPKHQQQQSNTPQQQSNSLQQPPLRDSPSLPLHQNRVKTPTPPLSGSPGRSPNHSERKSVEQVHETTPPQEHKSPIRHQYHQQPPPPIPQPPEPQEDILSNMTDDLAADLVAKLMEDEEKQDKQWYYRDPQGQVQGPFTCTEMAEWFQSGYFTLNLLVRRACDPNYAPLGELIKLWGCIPFLPEIHPLNKECAALLNNQFQDHYLLHHYQQHMRSLFYRQQQQPRPQPQPSQVPKLQHDWLDPHQASLIEPVLPPQYQPQVGVGVNALHQHTNTNNHLRALLAQLQQQAKSEVTPPPVMDTLMSLAQQQQAAVSGQTPIQALLRHMQQQSTKLHHQQQQQQQQQQIHPPSSTGIDSVWNGGGSWNQWSHVNTKGIKTEQQVIEEQLRAEYLRKREELMKAAEEEEAKGKEEEEKVKKEREKQEEAAKREEENLARRRAEEEEIRKKQEASRRAEVERQKKGEEKRRKEEEKRKKEEEKRKKEEENRERERAREEERKRKEAEEAKKRAQQAADVMAKVQRSQWCPPAASNTTILDIQRSEREQQQILRGLQQQAAQQHMEQQQQQQQVIGSKGGLQLKWTEPSARPQTQVESLADIQAEQQRQFLKQLEKEKEREKEKAAAAAAVAAAANAGAAQSIGSWSHVAWPASPWQTQSMNQQMSNVQSSKSGFWEYEKNSMVGGSGRIPQQQSEPPKSVQNKAKREELAVMKLFNQSEEDEFSMWCARQLTALQANVEISTFIQFLREIESPSEVLEYVRMYLGETKEASDFARQFVERRAGACGGRGLSLLSSSSQDDRDFQQVKGKSKKTKKGRMQKVDTRMLGFSTTAAPDRINVGDREYPE